MKIIRQTPSELVLTNESITKTQFSFIWFLLIAVIGIPFFGKFQSFSYSGITTLTCQRVEPKQVNCERVFSNALGFKKTTTFKNVTKSVIKPSDEESTENYNIYIAFFTKTGEVRGIEDKRYLSNENEQERNKNILSISAKINSFLSSNQSTIVIQGDTTSSIVNFSINIFIFVSLGMFMGFVFMCVGFKSVILTFDKQSNRFIKQIKQPLRNQYKAQPLDEIKGIEIQTHKDDSFSDHTLKLLPPSINDRQIMSSTNKKEVHKIHDIIKNFLKL